LRESLLFALALATASPVAAPEELRTLFHSPEERARLDRLRRGEPLEIPGAVRAPRAPAVTGFVKRSDGRDTVWLDGTPKAMTGATATPFTDPSKVHDPQAPQGPAIEIKRSR
jgi:hypothetical protein